MKFKYPKSVDSCISDKMHKILIEKVNKLKDHEEQLHELISKKILNLFGYPVDCTKIVYARDNKVQYVVNGVIVAEVQKYNRWGENNLAISYFIMSDEDLVKLAQGELI